MVFYSQEENKYLVKRLIGEPGDTVDIRSGSVYINGEYFDEFYVKSNSEYTGTFNVPENSYFFLGDNRGDSRDARYWENTYIHKDYIIAKVLWKLYPNFGGVN